MFHRFSFVFMAFAVTYYIGGLTGEAVTVTPSTMTLSWNLSKPDVFFGDVSFSFPDGDPLVLDATDILHPDLLVTDESDVTWYCWSGNEPFTPQNSLKWFYLDNVGGFGCHWFSSSVMGAKVIISASDTDLDLQYFYVVRVIGDSFTYWKSVEVTINAKNKEGIQIECVENCGHIMSPGHPMKLYTKCSTCSFSSLWIMSTAWTIRRKDTWQLISDDLFSATKTTTGLESKGLSLIANALQPGKQYRIMLSEDRGSYYKIDVYATQPPYNGQCSVNPLSGFAMFTKFVMSCDSFLDEGNRTSRDILTDVSNPSPIYFKFYYRYTSSISNSTSSFLFDTSNMTTGAATSAKILLPAGHEMDQRRVELVAKVLDSFGTYTEILVPVEVQPSPLTASEQLTSAQYQGCTESEDVTCLLSFSISITEQVYLLENKTEGDAESRSSLISYLKNVTSSLNKTQDTMLAVATLEGLQADLSSTTVEEVSDLSTCYENIMVSYHENLERVMTIDEKHEFARAIMNDIIAFCQKTKYDRGCIGDCEGKLMIGKIAVDLIEMTKDITAVMLKGSLPDEGGNYVVIPEGTSQFYTRRRNPNTLMNSPLDVDNTTVAEIPDLSQVIDPNVVEYIDVEVLISDNLYTTDDSVTISKTRTTSIILYDNNGTTIQVENLQTPISIKISPDGLQNIEFTLVNLTFHNSSQMYFVSFYLNETNVVPALMVKQSGWIGGCINYVLKIGARPDVENFDIDGAFCAGDHTELANNAAYYVKQFNEMEFMTKLQARGKANIYIGMYSTGVQSDSEISVAYNARGCSYWMIKEKRWSTDGLKLGTPSDTTNVICESNHLTTFSVNFFVPPNTINFETVFTKFSPDNVAVMSTVFGILGVYFLLIFFVRRADNKDHRNWATYPLIDNVSSDIYHYQITVYTGLRKNAGTDAKIFFVICGDENTTDVRCLQDSENRKIERGSVMNFLLGVPKSLGDLKFMRIWLEEADKGDTTDWYLNMITTTDIKTGEKYHFICDDWLSLTKGGEQIAKSIPVAADDHLSAFDHAFYHRTRKDLTDGHLWISVVSRPTSSVFTRVQRWSCCLSLLFLTMVTNAMWYQTREDSNQQNVHLGPFTFSAQEVTTSIMSSFIVVPVNLLIIFLFRKSERTEPQEAASESDSEKQEPEECNDDHVDDLEAGDHPALGPKSLTLSEITLDTVLFQDKQTSVSPVKRTKKKLCRIPRWVIYIAWALVALSVIISGFFTILYSFEWGKEKSSKWLTAFTLSFMESVLLIQPLKVIVAAVFLILIFKSPTDDDDDIKTNVSTKFASSNSMSPFYLPHRKPMEVMPITEGNVEKLRLNRKRMNRMFNIMREIVLYVLYLTVIIVMAMENRDKHAFLTHTNIVNTFIRPNNKHDWKLLNISQPHDLWAWFDTVLIPGLYSEGWYNGHSPGDPSDTFQYLSDNIHYRVGTPRVRQARVVSDACKIQSVYRKYFHTCYLDYGMTNYDDGDYSEGWMPYSSGTNVTQWTYHSALELNSYPVIGTYGSYSGGGYLANLGSSNVSAAEMLHYLKRSGWIDRQTRAFMLEANVFNPNINLFVSLRFTIEFPTCGSIVPFIEIAPVVVYRYVGASAIFILIFDIMFICFTLYNLWVIFKKMKEEKCAFLKKFWNIIDLLMSCLSVLVIAFYAMHFVMVKLAIADFQKNRDAYLNLQHIVTWNQLAGIMLSFLLFLAMIHLLRLLRFNSKITQLSGTIKRLSEPLMSFMVVFTSTFVAFAQFGYLVFGYHDAGYCTFINALETLMSMLMMKMEIEKMVTANQIMASAYLFLFVLFIVFGLLNILLSIINDAFTDVRKDPKCLPDDPKMVSFFIEKIRELLFGRNEKDKENNDKIHNKEMIESVHDLELKLHQLLVYSRKDS